MTTTTIYTWNPLTDSIIEESDGSGNSLCTYTNEPSQFGPLISENRGGTTSYYHADVIGSTRLTKNSSQAVVDTFLFDAWGNTVASTEPTTTPYQWCGRWGYQTDAVLVNAYIRARTYQPGVARWLSIDPLVLSPAPELQWYFVAYNMQKGSQDIDPTGLAPEDVPNSLGFNPATAGELGMPKLTLRGRYVTYEWSYGGQTFSSSFMIQAEFERNRRSRFGYTPVRPERLGGDDLIEATQEMTAQMAEWMERNSYFVTQEQIARARVIEQIAEARMRNILNAFRARTPPLIRPNTQIFRYDPARGALVFDYETNTFVPYTATVFRQLYVIP